MASNRIITTFLCAWLLQKRNDTYSGKHNWTRYISASCISYVPPPTLNKYHSWNHNKHHVKSPWWCPVAKQLVHTYVYLGFYLWEALSVAIRVPALFFRYYLQSFIICGQTLPCMCFQDDIILSGIQFVLKVKVWELKGSLCWASKPYVIVVIA